MFVEVRRLAKHGDARAIAILIEIMNQTTVPSMRAEILDILACMGADSDYAKGAIVAHLQYPEASVRIGALQAFSHFVGNASRIDMCAVFECLEDEREDVRFEAVQVLTHIASKVHRDFVVSEVKKRLAHVSGGVRRAAVQTLSYVTAREHDRSECEETMFIPLLEDCDPDVRAAAVQAIDAAPDNQEAFKGLVAVLFDSDAIVRQLALRALKKVVRKDARFLILSAKPYLRHDHESLRCQAVEALLQVPEEAFMDEDVASDFKRLSSQNDLAARSLKEFDRLVRVSFLGGDELEITCSTTCTFLELKRLVQAERPLREGCIYAICRGEHVMKDADAVLDFGRSFNVVVQAVGA
jgi:HEAT repeat protein